MLVSANNLSERGGHRAALGKNSKTQALVAPRREPLSFDRELSGRSTQTTKGASMRYLSLVATIAAAMILAAFPALAVPITLTANLTGANEFPPTGSPGTGFATVVLDTKANTMQVKV